MAKKRGRPIKDTSPEAIRKRENYSKLKEAGFNNKEASRLSGRPNKYLAEIIVGNIDVPALGERSNIDYMTSEKEYILPYNYIVSYNVLTKDATGVEVKSTEYVTVSSQSPKSKTQLKAKAREWIKENPANIEKYSVSKARIGTIKVEGVVKGGKRGKGKS